MKAGNGSTAVMQRRDEAADSLDDFPTPPWATRALLKHVLGNVGRPTPYVQRTAWEPCCNRGYMAKPLGEQYRRVIATDIADYGWEGQHGLHDFLMPFLPDFCVGGVDDVFANPPFRLAREFIDRGLQVARETVSMIVRSAFLEGIERYEELFYPRPPTLIAQFAERVVMVKGRLLNPSWWYWDDDADDGKGKWKRPTSATAYCWLVWSKLDPAPKGGLSRTMWIPPCRLQLERDGDYPPPPPAPEHAPPRPGAAA